MFQDEIHCLLNSPSVSDNLFSLCARMWAQELDAFLRQSWMHLQQSIREFCDEGFTFSERQISGSEPRAALISRIARFAESPSTAVKLATSPLSNASITASSEPRVRLKRSAKRNQHLGCPEAQASPTSIFGSY